MFVKINDLMTSAVVSARPHHSVQHVRNMLERNRVSAVPVIDTDSQPVGIVSATDLSHDLKPGTPVSRLMTKKVYTVPRYDNVAIAARVMRNHAIHHVVVTHEQQVVGMLSAFDLLRLVEEHRYVAKNAPTPPKRGWKRI